ncbi:MAG: ABC transporter, partial [Brooklawnia sp.]
PLVGRLPLPTVLLLGGGLAGLLVGLLARVGVELDARAKAVRAQRVVARSITEVADQLVIAPVNDELERYNKGRVQATNAVG